jgi:hypothetical protein
MNGLISLSNKVHHVPVKPFEIHGERCRCGGCEEIRVEKLIRFFKPEVNRMKLMSESESSDG